MVAEGAAAPQPEVSRVAADREIPLASAGGARVAVGPRRSSSSSRGLSCRCGQGDRHGLSRGMRASLWARAWSSYEHEFEPDGRRTEFIDELMEEVVQRSLCVQAGGEIPCHFSTLTDSHISLG